MFIKVDAATATLEDADNFKAFKVTTSLDPAHQPTALATIGRPDGDHVWISPDWLKANGRPDDPAWLAGLGKMLDYAKSAGWMDDAGAVRAHVER